MFETLVCAGGPSRSGRRSALIVGSTCLHAAVAAGLVMAGMWRIDKLSPEKQPVVVAHVKLPDLPDEPKPHDRALPPEGPPSGSRAAMATARLPDDPADAVVMEDAPTHYGTVASDGVDGAGGGGGGGVAVGVACGGTASCLERLVVPKPELPELPEAPPPLIPEKFLDGARVAGNDQIQPPDRVRTAMMRDGKTSLRAVISMCLDDAGRVTRLGVFQSSGYPDYDARFLSAMRSWRYEPYRQGAKPIPVCTHIHFQYVMR